MTQEDIFVLAVYIRRENLYCENRANVFNDAQLETLAAFCKNRNKRFDRERFLDYIDGMVLQPSPLLQKKLHERIDFLKYMGYN